MDALQRVRHGRVGRLRERPARRRRRFARGHGQILAEIQDGSFAKRWIGEADAGFPEFLRLRQQARTSQLESVGRELRRMMPWLESDRKVRHHEQRRRRQRSQDLRHHPARRGAGSRHRAHESREGRDRRAAGAAARRHPGGRVPDLLARRVRRRARDRRLGEGTRDRRPRPHRHRRHRAGGRGAQGRRPLAHPHLHLHERRPARVAC